MSRRIPASERTREALSAPIEGRLSSENGRPELARLATRRRRSSRSRPSPRQPIDSESRIFGPATRLQGDLENQGSFLARYRHSGELSLTRLISAMDRAPSPKRPFENPSLSHFHALNAASQMRETGGFLWFRFRHLIRPLPKGAFFQAFSNGL